LFDPAGFIISDACIIFIQFHFDLFMLIYLSCLFSIANLDNWLTVHRSLTLVNFQLDAQNSLFCLYITHLLKSSTYFEQYAAHLQEV